MLFDPAIVRPYIQTQRPPYVSKTLIVINVLVFLAMCLFSFGHAFVKPNNQLLLDWGANWAPLTLNGQTWRLFTATFIHIGIMHILMNMVILWQVGPPCESLFGRAKFLFIYLISGISGFLCSTMFNSNAVCAGASGAIIGLFGAYFAFLYTHRKELGIEVFTQCRNVFFIYIVYCGIYGFTVNADFAGHAGGLIIGFLFGYFLTPSTKSTRSLGKVVFSVLLAGALVILFFMEQSGIFDRTEVVALGQTYLLEHQQKLDDSIAQFQQQIKNHKADKKTYLGLAYCNWKIKNIPGAIKYQTLAIANGANANSNYILRAEMYSANEQWKEAMDDVNHVLSQDPTNDKSLLTRIKILYRQGKEDEVIKGINSIIASNPKDNNARWLAAQIYLSFNHPEECIAQCKKLVEVDNKYIPTHALLAKAYAVAGHFKDASNELQLIKFSTDIDENIAANMVESLLLQKEYGKANAVLAEYLEAHPKSYWAKYLQANVSFASGDYEKADAEALSAASFTESLRERTWCSIIDYLAQNRLKSAQASQLLVSCLDNDADKSEWTYKLGSYLLGKISVKDLLTAAKTREQKTEAGAYIGLKMQQDGKPAFEYFKQSIDIGSTDCTEYYLAKSQLSVK